MDTMISGGKKQLLKNDSGKDESKEDNGELEFSRQKADVKELGLVFPGRICV